MTSPSDPTSTFGAPFVAPVPRPNLPLAIAVAFLVGWAVRTFGRGRTRAFGIAGGLLAIVGVALGEIFSFYALWNHEHPALGDLLAIPFGEVIDNVERWPVTVRTI